MQEYQVKLTEGEVKMVGEHRWARDHWRRLIVWPLGLLVFLIGWGFTPETLLLQWVGISIFVSGFVVYLVYLWVVTNKAGKAFLAKTAKKADKHGGGSFPGEMHG